MAAPPLRLDLLGGVDCRGADGARLLSFLAQPKRVALLAYVAMEAPGGFVARERVMSVLWPDSDNTRARQSLRNCLYQIRQSLGAEVLTNRGSTDVGVNPSMLCVDAVALRAAVAEGRFVDAAALYRGSFLTGFHIDDAPEFEEWAGRTRAILEVDALRAFREAARDHESSGDLDGAGLLLRRAQEIAPADEEILRQRLLLLARQGNRAAAVSEGEEWIEALRTSLEIDPSEPTLRLMQDLRSGSPLVEPAPVLSPTSSPTPVSPGTTPPAASPVPPPHPGPGPRALSSALRWLPVVGLVAWLAWIGTRRPPVEPTVDGVVIVQSFDAADAAGGQPVGDALGALTARYLQPHTGGLVLSPEGLAAASFDGRNRRLILGRVRLVNDSLVADVELATTEHPERTSARATAAVKGRDLEALAIRLVDALAGSGALDLAERGPVPRFTRAPGALIPYFEGEILSRGGRTREASDAYRRALDLDSTFAMAYYRLGVTEALLGRPEEASAASDRAVQLSVNLTEGERRLLDAWRAYQTGGVEQAIPRYEQLAKSRGPDPEVWLRLADLRFHWGPQLGIPKDSAASAFRLLLRLVPDDVEASLHLIRLLGPGGDPDELDRMVRELRQRETSEDVMMEATAIVALSRRRPLDASVAGWVSGGSMTAESRRLTQLAASAKVPYDLAGLVRALPPTADSFRLVARRLLLAQLAASSGRMQEAQAELDTLSALNPYRAAEYRAFLALSSPVEPPSEALRAVRQSLRSTPDSAGSPITLWTISHGRMDAPRAITMDAMITLRLGEPVDSSGLMARGRAASHYFDPSHPDYLRAEIAAKAGDHVRVLAALGPGASEWGLYGDPLSYLVGTSKWTRIRSLVALGRDEEALRWLETIPDYGGYDLIYVAPASLLRAQILERFGRNREAASAYRRAAAIWSDADPTFGALADLALTGAQRTGTGAAG